MARSAVVYGRGLPSARSRSNSLGFLVLKQGEAVKELDCRPSDAMCLAVQVGAPIFVADDLMEKIGLDKQDKTVITVNGVEVSSEGAGIDLLVARLYPGHRRE